jgi:hypothetical protein
MMSKRFAMLVAALAPILLVGGYSLNRVECPYCHGSDANQKGACVHREVCGYCDEDYYAEHYNKATCPWCSGAGEMSGCEALAD